MNAAELTEAMVAKWEGRDIPMFDAGNGVILVPRSFLDDAGSDIGKLLAIIHHLAKSEAASRRKARKAKRLQGSPGDTQVKGVAEQALYQSVGANADSDLTTKAEVQSHSVRASAGGPSKGHAGSPSGERVVPGNLALGKALNPVGGRQSPHPLTVSPTTAVWSVWSGSA